MKMLLGFVLISGVGWLLDMAAYAGLSQLSSVAPPYANFISSMIGVTYVWIVALNQIFHRREYRGSIYLLIYWCFQGISILGYSGLIVVVSSSVLNSKIGELFGIPLAISSKIIITGPNLFTNYIFMSALTKVMRHGNNEAQRLL